MLLSRMAFCYGEEKNPPIPCSKGRKAAKFEEHIGLLLSIKGCAREKDLEKGTRIYTEIVKKGLLKKNISVGNTLVHMYTKCGSLVKAQRVFDELPVRNVVSWTALIAGYAKYGLGKVSVKCFEEMQYEGLLPNEVTFVCTLKACGSIGAVEKGNEIHSEIVKEGILGESDLLGTALVDMYAKCGAIEDARKVFDNLHDPSLVLWTALISGYAENGHGDEALKCYEHMQHKGLVPDAVTFSCILKACGSIGASEKAKEIHAEILRGGLLGKDIILGNALMDMYGKFHAVLKVQEVFDQHHLRDAVTWNILISGYCQQGHGIEALSCFARMQCEAFPPDAVTFSCILKACGNLCATQKGKEIHSMIEIGVSQMNSMVGSALVEMYAKCGFLCEADVVLESLPNKNVYSWNAIISGYMNAELDQDAIEAFEEMKKDGVEPDKATYSCILKACGDIRAVKKVHIIHDLLIKCQFQATNAILNALINMYANCMSLIEAQAIFDRMQSKDEVSWSTLIAGYALTRNWSMIMYCLEEMQQQGFKPTNVLFVTILGACSKAGLLEEGCSFFVMMTKYFSLNPDIEHYNCMIDLFGRSGHFKEALDLLQLIPSESGTVGWGSLLTNCSNHGNSGLGRQCFNSVVHMDLSHATAYVHIFNIYGNHEMWEEARKIVELRSSMAFGWKKPGKAWIEVGSKIFDFIVGDQSHQQSLELFAKLNRLTKALTIEGHVPHFMSMIPSISERKETSF